MWFTDHGTESENQNGYTGTETSKWVRCGASWLPADWELWLAATAQHANKGCPVCCYPGTRSKFKVQFLLNAYRFLTIVKLESHKKKKAGKSLPSQPPPQKKLESRKLNLHKSGIVCTVCLDSISRKVHSLWINLWIQHSVSKKKIPSGFLEGTRWNKLLLKFI